MKIDELLEDDSIWGEVSASGDQDLDSIFARILATLEGTLPKEEDDKQKHGMEVIPPGLFKKKDGIVIGQGAQGKSTTLPISNG